MACSAEGIQEWLDAVRLFENGQIKDSVLKLQLLNPNAKITFNIGCCFLTANDLQRAKQKFVDATHMDSHLAVAYFMLGQIRFLDKNYEEALRCYEASFNKLRGNQYVDYRPLGLNYKLYADEILTNQGIISQKMGRHFNSYIMKALKYSADMKKRDRISQLVDKITAGYSVSIFAMQPCKLFEPPKGFVSNVKKKDYLGKAKVISTENEDEIYSCFSGCKVLEVQASKGTSKLNDLETETASGLPSKTIKSPPRRPPKPNLTSLLNTCNTVDPKTSVKPARPKNPLIKRTEAKDAALIPQADKKFRGSNFKNEKLSLPIKPAIPAKPAVPAKPKLKTSTQFASTHKIFQVQNDSKSLIARKEPNKKLSNNKSSSLVSDKECSCKPISSKPKDDSLRQKQTVGFNKAFNRQLSLSGPSYATPCVMQIITENGSFPRPRKPRKPLPNFSKNSLSGS